MRRSRETINATVFATSVGIDAAFETDVGTLVVRDNRFRLVAKKLRFASRSLFHRRDRIDNVGIRHINMKFLEAIGRAPGSAATADRIGALRRFVDDRVEFLGRAPIHGYKFT